MRYSVLMLAAWLALQALPPARAAEVPAKDRIVIVMSIDGLPGYSLDDPRLPAPTLRRLAQEGAVAKGMRPVNPTVTWPNHTAMVTGVRPEKHQVLFNGLLVRPGAHEPVKVEPWRNKTEMVRAPTVYDLAHRAGLTTAQVDWVAIYHAPTITWEFAEIPDPKGPIEQEMIAAGLIQPEEVASFHRSSPVWRDEYWAKAAGFLVEKHKPNLLLYHLLNLDSMHHQYGPKSPAGYTGIAYADDRVKELLGTLRSAGVLDRTTLLIVSDHGFKNVRHQIRANVLLREQGLVRRENGKIACDAWVVPEGGTALVYVTDPAKKQELLPRLRQMFSEVAGVDRVLGPADFPALGLPLPEKSDQAPDLVLAAKDTYAFAGGDEGKLAEDIAQGGTHGYLNSDPEMQEVFVAWGYGVRPGARLGVIDNIDVAPTVAKLLGLSMTGVDGKVLSQALR